jgi:hypothetical protein
LKIYGIFAILIIGFLLITGCTQDNDKYCRDNFPGSYYDPSSKMCEHYLTPTAQIVYVTVTVTPSPTPIPTSKKPTATPTTMKPFPRTTYQIGETASNGLIKITVNGIRFVDKILSIGPGGVQEYELSSRGQWECVKITIENIQPNFNVGYESLQFRYNDNKYGTHTGPVGFFYRNTSLTPGQKITDEACFQVTKNPSGIQLEYTSSAQKIYFNI